ncbi:9539_t:CDS:1, partial [Scutellospora calospora]
ARLYDFSFNISIFFELHLIISNWETNPIKRKKISSSLLSSIITAGNSKSHLTDRCISNNNVQTINEIEPSSMDEKITISLTDNLCETFEQYPKQCLSVNNIQEIESADTLRDSSVIDSNDDANSIKKIESLTVNQNDSLQDILYDDEIDYAKNNGPQESST